MRTRRLEYFLLIARLTAMLDDAIWAHEQSASLQAACLAAASRDRNHILRLPFYTGTSSKKSTTTRASHL